MGFNYIIAFAAEKNCHKQTKKKNDSLYFNNYFNQALH